MKLRLIIFIFTFIQAVTSQANVYKQAEIYTDLRKQVLSLNNEQLGMNNSVLGVLMETGYEGAVATLVAVADGTSSLYFSNGGGIIGSGEYKQVHDQALKFVKLAGSNINIMKLTKKFPLPKKSYTCFYVITSKGVYTAEVIEADLGNKKHNLSPVFIEGHKLLSFIRAADEHRNNK